jgi:hypothetical protein
MRRLVLLCELWCLRGVVALANLALVALGHPKVSVVSIRR